MHQEGDAYTAGGNARREELMLRAFATEGVRRRDLHPEAGLRPQTLARAIDHTLLAPQATRDDVETLCREAAAHGFAAVCVNSRYVPFCTQLLAGTAVQTCTVVGFPLGACDTETKALEARRAVQAGAGEVDMVIPVGALRGGDHAGVYRDVAAVRRETLGLACLKVIIECVLLSDPEKITACRIAVDAGADFVKTSTGFAGGGATLDDVRLLRETVGPDVGVKAAGGIRDRAAAEAMLAAGANRIGTSSGVAIVAG